MVLIGMTYLRVSSSFQGAALPTGSRLQRKSWDAVGDPERISDRYDRGVGFVGIPRVAKWDWEAGPSDFLVVW